MTSPSFVGDDCCVLSFMKSFVILSPRDWVMFSQLRFGCFVEEGIGVARSTEIVIEIPFSSMVILCDDIFTTRKGVSFLTSICCVYVSS